MFSKSYFFKTLLSFLLVISIVLANVSVAFADDGSQPPDTTETAEPTDDSATPPVVETPAPDASLPTEEGDITLPKEETLPEEEQTPAEEEAADPSLFEVLPENVDVVILGENGETLPLASQEAAEILEEADPIWCPASQTTPTPGANGCTINQTITGLLTLMRNNPGNFDEDGIIYLEKPGGAGFTTPLILDSSAGSLGTSYNTLKNFNLTIQGGWNGGVSTTLSGDTNFGVNGGNQGYIKVGTSTANPWVGNIIIRDINLNDITSNVNPSLAVYTSTGSVTLNDVDVDNADNSESVRITTVAGSITISDSEVTNGDDDYGFNLTTTSGNVTLNNVLVDNHTDGDGINISAGTGNVTLNNADVTDGDDGDGINITTTGGNVNLIGVDVTGADDGNGINVTTDSGDITFNDTDVSDQRSGRTASLISQSGDILIFNGSDFEGDNTNYGFFASTTTGSITITGTNGNRIDFLDASGPGNTNYNGATLSAPTVSLTYVNASNNDLNGIAILNANIVTLNNVFVDDNGTNPFGPNNSLGSGVYVNGTGATIVNVSGGSYTDNERYGIEVFNGTVNVTLPPFFDDNGYGNIYPDPTPPVITPNVSCWGMVTNAPWCRGWAIVTWDVDDLEAGDNIQTSGCNTTWVTNATSYSGTNLTCTATSNGGTSSNTVTIYVDFGQPTLNLPGNITEEATSSTGANVSFSATASDSVDPSVTPVCTPASGSLFVLDATTTVNCTATDDAGNSRSGSFTVTVQDTTGPTLSLTDVTSEATGPSGASVTFSASATDLVDGSVPVTCSSASGDTFPIGTTVVTCSATDTRGNSSNGNFNVTVQDTTPPVIASPANIEVSTGSDGGAVVTFSAPATSDAVDGAGVASCVLASGSLFPVGANIVTCTATDAHGNSAMPVTFLVNVTFVPNKVIPVGSAGFIIPITGGELIELDCLTVANAFGIRVTFHNLCEHQSVITEITADTLPNELPDGLTFAQGLNVTVLSEGQLVEELPLGTGVQLDFPISADAHEQFAVLLWDAENKEWLDVTQSMKDDQLGVMLSTDAEDELYQVVPTETTKELYRILTTEKTGTFVIVKK